MVLPRKYQAINRQRHFEVLSDGTRRQDKRVMRFGTSNVEEFVTRGCLQYPRARERSYGGGIC